MARIRTIKPELWESQKLAELPRDARLLFIGLFSNADDQGRMRANARYVHGRVFPYDDPADVDTAGLLLQLHDAGFIQIYTVDGSEYLVIDGFTRHQRIDRPSVSSLPDPPKKCEKSIRGTFAEASANLPGGLVEASTPRACVLEEEVDQDMDMEEEESREGAAREEGEAREEGMGNREKDNAPSPNLSRGERDHSADAPSYVLPAPGHPDPMASSLMAFMNGKPPPDDVPDFLLTPLPSSPSTARFKPPLRPDVNDWFAMRSRADLAASFWKHYNGNGWTVGNPPERMCDWQYAAEKWIERQRGLPAEREEGNSPAGREEETGKREEGNAPSPRKPVQPYRHPPPPDVMRRVRDKLREQ